MFPRLQIRFLSGRIDLLEIKPYLNFKRRINSQRQRNLELIVPVGGKRHHRNDHKKKKQPKKPTLQFNINGDGSYLTTF